MEKTQHVSAAISAVFFFPVCSPFNMFYYLLICVIDSLSPSPTTGTQALGDQGFRLKSQCYYHLPSKQSTAYLVLSKY
jgi:hypothetical protein